MQGRRMRLEFHAEFQASNQKRSKFSSCVRRNLFFISEMGLVCYFVFYLCYKNIWDCCWLLPPTLFSCSSNIPRASHELFAAHYLHGGFNMAVCRSVTYGALRQIFVENFVGAFVSRFFRYTDRIFVFCRFLDISLDFSRDFCPEHFVLSIYCNDFLFFLFFFLIIVIHFLFETTIS